MRKIRLDLMGMVLLFGLCLQSAIADTEVSGNITSPTIWTVAGSPYIVVGTVQVLEAITLIIEPGVTVKLNEGQSLIIDGMLIAQGTETDSIFFTSNDSTPQPGDWRSIKFDDTSVDALLDALGNYVSGCILEYCRIEYGGHYGTANEGTVTCFKASPFISHNTITKNSLGMWNSKGGGIHCWRSNPTIRDNTITGNSAHDGGAIFCDDSSPTISRNTIAGNSAFDGGGFSLHHGASPIIHNNIITGNSATGGLEAENRGGAIYCYDLYTDPLITDNTIAENYAVRGGGIWCAHSSSPTITNNNMVGNSASYGSGIYCEENASPTINYNNLVNQDEYEIYLGWRQDNDIDATYNWWGTTNTDTIDIRIRDYYDNDSLGKVLYDPVLTSPAVGEPDSVYLVVLKADETYTSDLTTNLWIGDTMYIQLEGKDSDSICVNQTTVTITSDSTDTLGIRIILTETDSVSGIFRGTALIDSVSEEGVSIGATVGETITITSDLDSTKFTTVAVVEVGIKQEHTLRIPKSFSLSQNYPNPFNPVTEIKYALPGDCEVRLEIYSILGRRVASLANGKQTVGYKVIHWDASPFSSGIYFYRLKAGDFMETRKMVVLK